MNSSKLVAIKPLRAEDAADIFAMMREFYDSPALLRPTSDEVLRQNIADCVGACPFIQGYVFWRDVVRVGYAMVSMGYSTERGGLCAWLEDIYVQPEHRGVGVGAAFFAYMEQAFAGSIVRSRLDVAPGNARAMEVYARYGYAPSPYIVMEKEWGG